MRSFQAEKEVMRYGSSEEVAASMASSFFYGDIEGASCFGSRMAPNGEEEEGAKLS